MKTKIFTTLLLVLFAALSYASDVTSMVAVSADGDNTTYALADVKRIDVVSTETSSSLTVINKDGSTYPGYIKLLFAIDEPTEIESVGEVAVYVYPNPVSNVLNIMGVDDNASLYVYSLSGQCIMKEKGTELDVTSLLQGTYILRINDSYVKFIKK
jgi:hypothetical protein